MALLSQELDTALDRLLETPSAERPRMLEELAGGQADLKAELASLLPFLEGPQGPLDGGIGEAADQLFHQLEKDLIGDAEARYRQLGPYRLGERLGSGAMGRVYRGQRSDGAFERQVAIKIQRWELPDEHLVRRFERERQILAQLDHPAIARLLDGGVTDDGVPYLVMELVDGAPIDVYCRREGLSVERRLQLFSEVVAAVQAAHSQLIIHRDIKPSNVLVTGDGQVKLLDFGVAKLLEPSLDPGLTQADRGPLTYGYASPEQLLGSPLGVASDVYSLGVLLYELLAGRAPFAQLDVTRPDPRILSQLPPPPSQCTPAPSPATEPLATGPRLADLAKSARRDLDAIALKALEPEVVRRFATAAELGADLRRWSEGRPVAAMPPSRGYRLRKLIQRNRLAAILCTLIVLSLFAGVLGSSRQARRANQQRAQAQRLADFALDILRLGDPEAGGSTTLSARRLLETSTEGLASLEDPIVRSQVQAVIGEGLLNLQVYDQASELLQGAASLRGHPTRIDPETADILATAALAEAADGNLPAALALIDRTIAFREQQSASNAPHSTSPALARALHRRAFLLARYTPPTAPERHEVIELLERAIEIVRTLDPAANEALARSLHLLGMQKFAFANLDQDPKATALKAEGFEHMREATEIRRQRDRADGSATAIESLNDLALALDTEGEIGQAITLLVEALALSDAHLSPGHPTDLMLRSNLAAMYRDQGDLARAEQLYLDILEGWRVADLSPSPQVLYGLAFIRTEQGELDRAEELVRDALALIPGEGPAHWIVSTLLGDILRRQGKTVAARAVLTECVRQTEAIFGPHSRQAADAKAALAALDGRLE